MWTRIVVDFEIKIKRCDFLNSGTRRRRFFQDLPYTACDVCKLEQIVFLEQFLLRYAGLKQEQNRTGCNKQRQIVKSLLHTGLLHLDLHRTVQSHHLKTRKPTPLLIWKLSANDTKKHNSKLVDQGKNREEVTGDTWRQDACKHRYVLATFSPRAGWWGSVACFSSPVGGNVGTHMTGYFQLWRKWYNNVLYARRLWCNM